MDRQRWPWPFKAAEHGAGWELGADSAMNGVKMQFAPKTCRLSLLCYLVWPLSAAVTITPYPKELVIVGVADGKTATYKNSVWIRADAKVAALQILPPELKGPGGPIPISAVHLNNPLTLEVGVQRELSVSVDTPLLQGEFKGDLVLSSPPDTTEIARVPVVLRLTPKPSVTAVPAAFAFKAIRCGNWVTCRFSDFVLPLELNNDWRSWQLINQTPADVDWTLSIVTLRGDKSGNPITDLSVKIWRDKQWADWSNPTHLPTKKATYASFQFDRGKLLPDHYQGQYRIEVKDGDPITLPFTFDVRDGIMWPIVVLLAGIVLGRVIQSTNTPRAQAQMRLMDRFQSVAASVETLKAPAIRQSLRDRLDQIMIDIRMMSRTEADLSGQLDAIQRLAANALKLDLEEVKIQQLPDDDPRKATLMALLASARAAVAEGNFASAEKDLDNINNELGGGGLSPRTMLSAPVAAAVASAKPNIVVMSLSWLSGAEPLDSRFLYTYLRPFLFLLLLVLLASIGLYNSYVKNATFGVEGYFDYLSLFLWGISADVAQKTLQNLSLPRNS
jgi:hypothetical protein